MIPFLAFILFAYITLTMLCVLSQWLICCLIKVPVTTIRLLYGPPIASFTLCNTTIAIGFIPLGCSIESPPPVFDHKPLLSRLVVILTGPVSALCIAALFLDTPLALRHFSTGFIELLAGAYSPLSTAQQSITRLQEVFSFSPFATVGIIAAKLSALSLLPLGGMVPTHIMYHLLKNRIDQETLTKFCTFSSLVSLVFGALWILATVTFAWKGIF